MLWYNQLRLDSEVDVVEQCCVVLRGERVVCVKLDFSTAAPYFLGFWGLFSKALAVLCEVCGSNWCGVRENIIVVVPKDLLVAAYGYANSRLANSEVNRDATVRLV
jgi:hypothetical protein